jgi:hypothetical protein
MRSKTALRRDPSKPQTGGGLTQSLQRLSPGVYRDAGGRLTNQSGRALPQQPNRQPQMPPRGPAPYQPGNNMDRTAGAITGQGPSMVNLPGRLPQGGNPYELMTGIAGQQPPQQNNPSLQPENYQPGTYRPWYLPPQNAPWWTQQKSNEQMNQETPQGPSREQRIPSEQQPMSYEEWLKVFGNKRGTPV